MCSAWVGNILGFYLKQRKNNLRYRLILSGSMIAVNPGDNGLMWSNTDCWEIKGSWRPTQLSFASLLLPV